MSKCSTRFRRYSQQLLIHLHSPTTCKSTHRRDLDLLTHCALFIVRIKTLVRGKKKSTQTE